MIEHLGEHVPDRVQFNIGYNEGRQYRIRWLCCQDDPEASMHAIKMEEKSLHGLTVRSLLLLMVSLRLVHANSETKREDKK